MTNTIIKKTIVTEELGYTSAISKAGVVYIYIPFPKAGG